MDIKQKILQLISDKPKHYSRIIKADPILHEWVLNNTKSSSKYYPELIYSAIYNESPICKYGNTRNLSRFNSGFNYCGHQSECQCSKEHTAKQVKETKKLVSDDSQKATNAKRKESMVAKYGVEYNSQRPEFQNEQRKRNKEKYGVEHYFQTDNFASQLKKTNLSGYGVEHYFQSEDCRKKTTQTCLSKYNVTHFSKSPKFIEKIIQSSQEKYGVDHYNQRHIPNNILEILQNKNKFDNFITGKTSAEVILKLNVDGTTISKYAKMHDSNHLFNFKKSKWEIIISEFLDNLPVKYIQNTRSIIQPLELDFYFPDFNAAIEINGNYWHSEIAGGKDKKYHYNKWLACREQGIDLYSYFEDELIDNIDIIKSKIRYITGQPMLIIGARKCQLDYIKAPQEKLFLNQYHIQGRQGSRNKTLGAYYDGNLIAIFSWFRRKQYLEITRYACDTKASYPGLFSKMMKRMIRDLDYHGPIVSFSNNGHSNGGVYKASGFQLDKIIGGAYWYTKNYNQRENRQNYMKANIAKKFGIDMSCRTEWQAMRELGYDRIWDSGKIKWIMEV